MQELFARASALRENVGRAETDPQAVLRIGSLGQSAGSDSTGRVNFSDVLRDAVKGVSDAQMSAQAKAQAYQLGEDKVSLEDVMVSIQKAGLAMQGMVQVRNRLMEAYREIMNMQV
ncbi:MAG: flagellar hook-basal body complex protein FliE [Betaproteobacteria bacterium]|nr:flagellar hook-basal body complex protein FliE [Betaproteobacteria bacterium]NDE52984.1 flagellar hook-basal body complex protein FliE [Actinomycetota bacterium]